MRDHPIPQDIVGYKFHIIGNMTLKQFGELAAGALMGLLIYQTNLPGPLKWTFIAIAIGMGAAAAFLPIEERPLDHWILTFIKVMYHPTKYFWRRTPKLPPAFTYSPTHPVEKTEQTIDLSPARRQRIHEYLASVQPTDVETDPLAQNEKLWLQEIMANFETITPQAVKATAQPHKPDLSPRPHSLHKPKSRLLQTDSVTVFDSASRQSINTKFQKAVEEVAITTAVPTTDPTEVEKQHWVAQQAAVEASTQGDQAYVSSDSVQAVADVVIDNQAATFNAALPFPSKPTEPNKVVGMLLTPNNELIPDAIVEIRDADNRVVRAVKSNALGQFFVTTPLHSGQYTLQVEHDRYQFPSLSLAVQNELIDPVEIRSLG